MRSAIAIIAFIIAAVVATLAIAAPQAAQTPQRPPAEPLINIKDTPMAKFVGSWTGTATHQARPGAAPNVVNMTEKAEWKLGETAIFVEGRGVMTDAETGEERVVHDAIGIIRVDQKSRKLMFYGFKAGEPANESELEVLDDGSMRWFMRPAPNALVRFTIHVTDETYTEVGEFSRDGGITFTPFMEMSLQRDK